MAIRQLKPGERVPDGEPKRYRSGHGYIRLRWKVGVRSYVEVYEHRVIDGRVTVAEQVHHENRRRDDNRPENLHQLTAEDHQREHESPVADEVVRRYAEGESILSIAGAVDRDGSSVFRILQRRGVKFRTRGGYHPDIDRDQLGAWHAAGVRVDEMVRRSGVARARIEAAMDEMGLPRFKPGNPLLVRSRHYASGEPS